MPKHVVDLLTNLGLPAEDAAKIDALPEAEQATFDTKPYAEKVKTNYQTQFQNDPAFFNAITLEKIPAEVSKKIEATQFARASNIMKGKILKGLGLTESDLGELTEEQKEKLDPFIGAVLEKYTKTKVGDKQLQADLIEARKKLEAFDGYEEKTKVKYEGESTAKITAAILNANIISDLASIPNLKIKASTLAQPARDLLSAKYGFAKDDDFSIGIRQKENPEMKVLKPGSSQELTRLEALTEIAIAEGWVEKEKESGTGTGKVQVTPQNGVLTMVAPHLQDKISQKIASESK